MGSIIAFWSFGLLVNSKKIPLAEGIDVIRSLFNVDEIRVQVKFELSSSRPSRCSLMREATKFYNLEVHFYSEH
jgi:hypothetical protein